MEEETPPRVAPRLRSAPKIREFFWCDFPRDAQLPEFWKLRPVIILSKNAKLNGTVIVVPCSTKAQPDNKWAKKLTQSINEQESWAICDKISTVAVSRLSPHKDGIRRVSEAEFNDLLKIVHSNLPQVRE